MADRWGNNGNSDRLYFLGLHNHHRHLLLGRKAMTKLQSVLKSRDITLPTKGRTLKLFLFFLMDFKIRAP